MSKYHLNVVSADCWMLGSDLLLKYDRSLAKSVQICLLIKITHDFVYFRALDKCLEPTQSRRRNNQDRILFTNLNLQVGSFAVRAEHTKHTRTTELISYYLQIATMKLSLHLSIILFFSCALHE